MRIKIFLGVAVLAAMTALGALAASLPAGNVVVTRASGDATALWNATAVLTTMVASKTPKEQIVNGLESDAAAVLADRARALRAHARTITLQVLYTRTGDISPAYRVATFEGIEHYMDLKATIKDALKNGAAWSASLSAGRPATGLTVKIVGKLPPEIQ